MGVDGQQQQAPSASRRQHRQHRSRQQEHQHTALLLLADLEIVPCRRRCSGGADDAVAADAAGAGFVAAFDVLRYLLEEGVLSERSLRDARDALLTLAGGNIGGASDDKMEEVVVEDDGEASKGGGDHHHHQQQQAPTTSAASAPEEKATGDMNGGGEPSRMEVQNAAAAPASSAPGEEKEEITPKRRMRRRKRHVALKVYYNGARYTGLAEQVGSPSDNSIERHLFRALTLSRLIDPDDDDDDGGADAEGGGGGADGGGGGNGSGGDAGAGGGRKSARYSRCGRTDRGVSANGQVVALHLNSAFGPDASADAEGKVPLRREDLPSNDRDPVAVYVLPRKNDGGGKKNKGKKKRRNQAGNDGDGDGGGNAPPTRCKRMMTEYAYDRILNNLLPDDIRVCGWCPVSDEFSARFSAANRTYRYFFVRRSRDLDLDKMRAALIRMVGRHDFRNFCKMNVEAVYNFERTIHEARIVVQEAKCGGGNSDDGDDDAAGGDVCYFEIVGQAFLWHQIRCIAAILFMVGRGLEPPSIVDELLDVEKHPGKPSYEFALAEPLVLHGCSYRNLEFGYSMSNLWPLLCGQERLWEERTLEAARIRNCVESLKGDARVSTKDVAAFAARKLEERKKKSRAGKKKKKPNGGEEVQLPPQFRQSDFVSLREALDWMRDEYGLFPSPLGAKETVHVPLLERSRGTTFEEKVAAVQKSSSKRKQRYEDNVVRKRKTKEEDKAFYEHMAKQGGI